MSFDKEKLRAASKAAFESVNYKNLVELSDEEFDRFCKEIESVEQPSYLHNATAPTVLHDGNHYVCKSVRGPSLDAIIWYVRSRLNNKETFYQPSGRFNGEPVFLYIVGKEIVNTFDLEENDYGAASVVEKTVTSYYVRISRETGY